MPKRKPDSDESRDTAILNLYLHGCRPKDIARDYGMTTKEAIELCERLAGAEYLKAFMVARAIFDGKMHSLDELRLPDHPEMHRYVLDKIMHCARRKQELEPVD